MVRMHLYKDSTVRTTQHTKHAMVQPDNQETLAELISATLMVFAW